LSTPIRFFATCAKGMEPPLAVELRAMGADDVRETRAGVEFAGPLEAGYRACLWSRLASRVLLPLTRFHCPDPEDLYDGVRALNWDDHLGTDGTLAVDFSTSQSLITHSRYGALRVKDAIVDQFRDETGLRPSVDTRYPDVRINVYLYRDEATVSLDLSGDALHRRGYRTHGGEAPLKESLAAAIIGYSRWLAIAEKGGLLVDLMCGSGTLLIEGALMAADVAPGLERDYFGFLRWREHDPALWAGLLEEARQRRTAGLARLPPIRGYDRDPLAIEFARENLRCAGLQDRVTVTVRSLAEATPETGTPGLVVANPPYGERLGTDSDLEALYAELGGALKRCFSGWRAAVFTGNPDLAHCMRLGADKKNTLYNGAIPCKLLHYGIG